MLLNRCFHSLRILSLLTLVFFLVLTHCTAVQAPAASPESQEFLNQGVESAKQQKWDEALSFFHKARQIDPLSPRVAFNSALVSDKAKRELLAMAWYRFYLALVPGVDNAPQVLARFPGLETATRNKIQKLKQLAHDAVKAVPNPSELDKYNVTFAIAQAITGDIEGARKVPSEKVMAAIAASQALAGDFEIAKQTAAAIKNLKQKGVAFKMIAEAYAAFGNIEEAKKTVKAIEHKEQRDDALFFLSRAQAFRRDIEGAKQTAKSIGERYKRENAYSLIAKAQLKQGDMDGAISTGGYGVIPDLLEMGALDQAISAVDRMSSYDTRTTYSKIMAYIRIANAQVDRGGHPRALETIQKALKGARSRKWKRNDFHDPQYFIYSGIIAVQGKAGDFKGVMETSKLPEQHVFDKLGIQAKIAEAQARAGKVKWAFKIASQAHPDKHKVAAYVAIADVLFEKGDMRKAKKAVKSAQKILRRMKKDGYSIGYVAKGHARLGNYDEAFRLAKTIKDEYEAGFAYEYIAEAQIKSNDVEGAWRTAVLEEAKRSRDKIFERIAEYYIKKGDLNGALWSAAHISNAYMEARTWPKIAERAIEMGEIYYWVPRIFGEAVLGKLGEAFLAWSSISGLDDFFLADAVMRHALKDDVASAKNMAIIIENDWIRGWALFWVALTQARVGDAAGANKTVAQIKNKKYRSLASEHINQRLQMIQTDSIKNKRVLSWSDWVVYLGSKGYLSHFQRTIDMLKTEDIQMDVHYLGAIAGNMTVLMKGLQENEARLQKHQGRSSRQFRKKKP